MKKTIAKPFLKWAGGKSQLLTQLSQFYPQKLIKGEITKYVEPFLGGGAVYFDLISKFHFEEVILNDINEELIITFTVVRDCLNDLINYLKDLESVYLSKNEEDRKKMFYAIRSSYNTRKIKANLKDISKESVILASEMIFLNKTCYNGLYRLNKKGEFNVPFGSYKNPKICDEDNLSNVSNSLQNVILLNVDFELLTDYIDDKTFVYMDPPYRPISGTASFNSYQKSPFNDDSQIRLAKWYRKIHTERKAALMLSNSDPTNIDPDDTFFEDLYAGFSIKKLQAARMINSKVSKRGAISELLIINENCL